MSGDVTLRGRCKEMAEAAVAADPSLTLVRGWYDDPHWGSQEHWWTTRPDGTIHDPTAAQFPVPNVVEWYRPFEGVYPCMECGNEVPEGELVMGCCCSGECYGRMVGVQI
jgi:hypothetical protein